MNSMSKIIQQMQQVNEPGLSNNQPNKQIVNEGSRMPLLNDKKSITNHILNYNKMMGIVEQKSASNVDNVNNPLTESNKYKMVGALQVVKEILSKDISGNPQDVLAQVKNILNDF